MKFFNFVFNCGFKYIPATIAVAAGLFMSSVSANPDVIRKEIQKKYPNVTVQSVLPTAFPGVWEIFTGTELFYSDDRASYIMLGRMIDVATQADISTPRLTILTAIKFDDLPLNLAMKTVNGKGTRKLAVFSDPNCGYCKRFEADLTTLTDTTVYTFLYPVLAADSATKAKQVWCAADRVKTWQDWMLRGVALPKGDKCDNPIDKVTALGQRLNLKAVPVSYFADGTKLEGAVPKATLESRILTAVGIVVTPSITVR